MANDIVIRSLVVSPAATNCYIAHLKDSKEAICVDPGDKGAGIADRISGEGLSLVAILLTHGHYDHIMGVEDLKSRMPAKVYAARAEKVVLDDPEINLTADWPGHALSLPCDEYLEDGAVINVAGMEIHMILTPGHTVGGCCFYLPNEGVCFTGDTLFHASIGRTDLPTGNYEDLLKSVQEKLFPLPDDTKLYPGHEDTSVLEWEKKHNPFFRGF